MRSEQGGYSIRSLTLLLLAGLVGIVLLSFSLAWIGSGFQTLREWDTFLFALLLSSVILAGAWWSLRSESLPRWLGGLLVGAALLRLLAGAFWFVALPRWGYDSPTERAGYVMADAADRDQAAWELASSGKPLVRGFQGSYRRADQYGGLLILSALIYRNVGAETHQPLLVLAITSAFSALSVLFVWALSQRAWGGTEANIAAWGLALYPEAVLLGSSQMREAITLTLTVVAFYGLARYWREHTWHGLLWDLAALVLCLPFSPPVTGLLMAMLAIQAVVLGRSLFQGQIILSRRFWIVITGLVVFVLIGLWLSWGQYAPQGVSNPLELLNWWLKKSADWQAHLSERASGWMQKIFASTPEWTHLPLLLAYGIVQPFLPAALSDVTGVMIWRSIAIWRALGWALVLPFLVYAPLRAWRAKGDPYSRGLSLVVWLTILIASFRGGGDMWDNPRYRTMFAGLQVALAAWVWAEQRRSPDPLWRRVWVSVLIILLWFLPWYLRRYVYLPWPIVDPFKVLGLGILTAVLYWIWDWIKRKPPP